jgi:hypothetical protein
MRITPDWAHHVDATGFDGRVPTSTPLDLRVLFRRIPIKSYCGTRCSSQRPEDGFPNWAFLRCHDGEIV